MKPTKQQRRLAHIVAEVVGINPRTLDDKKVIELADGVQHFFGRLLEGERRSKSAKM